MKHWAELSNLEEVKLNLKRTPDWLLGMKIWGVQNGVLDENRFLPTIKNRHIVPQIKALAARHAYLREQINKIDRVLVPTRLMENILTNNGLERQGLCFLPTELTRLISTTQPDNPGRSFACGIHRHIV